VGKMTASKAVVDGIYRFDILPSYHPLLSCSLGNTFIVTRIPRLNGYRPDNHPPHLVDLQNLMRPKQDIVLCVEKAPSVSSAGCDSPTCIYSDVERRNKLLVNLGVACKQSKASLFLIAHPRGYLEGLWSIVFGDVVNLDQLNCQVANLLKDAEDNSDNPSSQPAIGSRADYLRLNRADDFQEEHLAWIKREEEDFDGYNSDGMETWILDGDASEEESDEESHEGSDGGSDVGSHKESEEERVGECVEGNDTVGESQGDDEAEEKSDEDCEDDNKEEDDAKLGKDSCEKGGEDSNGAHGEESEEEHAAENE
jgi:hypothetical protein